MRLQNSNNNNENSSANDYCPFIDTPASELYPSGNTISSNNVLATVKIKTTNDKRIGIG